MPVGAEYPGEGMFGGIPMAPSGIVVIPPPSGLPKLQIPTGLMVLVPQHEFTKLLVNEYDTKLSIII